MSDDDTIEAPEEAPAAPAKEGAAWFRQALADLGETQSSLARLMQQTGDDRRPNTILRTVQRMANGEGRVSGEMRVILTMMKRAKDRGERRSGGNNWRRHRRQLKPVTRDQRRSTPSPKRHKPVIRLQWSAGNRCEPL